MKKSLIVAMAQNGTIGHKNSLPWYKLPGDLPRFRRLTMGKPCIMGRRTFESLTQPLVGRLNIIVTRQKNYIPKNPNNAQVVVVHSVLEAWVVAAEAKCEESFIIGGAEVYRQALPSCEQMYLTVIGQDYEGDTKFDFSDILEWQITEREYRDGPQHYQNLVLERGGKNVAQFLTLERLTDNPLPLPRYGTPQSAGIDFSACLTRPCKTVEAGTGNKKDFWVIPATDTTAYLRSDIKVVTAPDKVDNLALRISAGETILVPLGFKCSFDTTFVLKIYPRSSVGLKGIVLANGTGIIDPDYRGELFAALFNRTDRPIAVKHGERIVQGVLTMFSQGIVREGKVDETIRGEGGLGSTGQMANLDPMSDVNLRIIKRASAGDLPPESTPEQAKDGNEPKDPNAKVE